MQVDLSKVNQEELAMKPCQLGGVDCVLVEPRETGKVTWTKNNLIFRSSIWTLDGHPVSLGFPKFFNWDEDIDADGHPTNKIPYGKPKTLKGASFMDKLDGSLLIVSCYKGELVIRTRGTISAVQTLSNGDEIAFLKEKYAKAFGPNLMTGVLSYCAMNQCSLLFEWFSPRNKIVLDYGDEPKLWLVGCISHEDYSLASQGELDGIASLWDIPRPERYQFDTIEELRFAVSKFEGKEGVVIYPPNAPPWKHKSARYMALHYYKGDVATFDKVVDIWLSIGRPGYQAFYDFLASNYDWEIADYAKGHLSKICDADKTVADIEAGMNNFIKNQLHGISRKEQYERTVSAYGPTNRGAMVMALLDGKPLNDKQIKKLVLQTMKK